MTITQYKMFFLKLLKADQSNSEKIAFQYQESLSNSYRNKEGIYYTPQNITEAFFQHLPNNLADFSFCDPCCGSGSFILTAINYGVKPENIYGFDTDQVAVELTKKLILEYTGYETKQIIHGDFLEQRLNDSFLIFDLIFTNPPWGKKINKGQKEKYAQILGTGKSIDTCSLFFFACLLCLKKDGYLGFLLPESFFNISTFEDARKKALSLKIKAFIDFGKPFKELLTPAKGLILQNQTNHHHTPIECQLLHKKALRWQHSFQTNPKSIFNFACSEEEAKVIEHLYATSHLKLKEHAQYGLGIVTGNNKKYCISQPQKNYIPVYKGSDIYKDHLKTSIHLYS